VHSGDELESCFEEKIAVVWVVEDRSMEGFDEGVNISSTVEVVMVVVLVVEDSIEKSDNGENVSACFGGGSGYFC